LGCGWVVGFVPVRRRWIVEDVLEVTGRSKKSGASDAMKLMALAAL
jgi:hypothetical protein